MGQEEQFSSLFDMASKKQKKKQEEARRPEISLEPLSSEDLQAEFERCKEMYQQMKSKIENAYEQAKVSPRQIKDFLDNPTHFSAKEWRQIQKEKDEYAQKLRELLPPTGDQEMKPEENDSSRQKTPKGFVSKKRWLSMH